MSLHARKTRPSIERFRERHPELPLVVAATGTDLYEDLKPYIDDYDYANYNLVEPIIKPVGMTRDEVFQEVLQCYKKYYMWKFPQWLAMPKDDFKRNCLLRGMKAIMENSFLKDHMGGLGSMPGSVHNMVHDLALGD